MRVSILQSLAICILGVAALFGQEAATDGRNVHKVTYRTEVGVITLFQNGAASWREQAQDGARRALAEVSRDERRVLLQDGSRHATVELEMAARIVVYSERGQNRRTYAMASVSSKVNGWIVRLIACADSIRFAPVYLRQQQGDEWAVVHAESFRVLGKLLETGRDDWSVYLKDPLRNEQFRVDLNEARVVTGRRTVQTVARAW